MSTIFESILSDIFDRGAEQRLGLDEEREALRAAKSGDEEATLSLMYAYGPTLRAAVGRFRSFEGHADDLRSVAITGLLSAVQAFDPNAHERLAAIVAPYVRDALAEFAADSGEVAVPSRTRKRFFSILRAAGGDIDAAAALAPKYEMSRETFFSVREALNVGEFDGNAPHAANAVPMWAAIVSDADDRILVELAFSAVDDLETDVCRLYYGFAEYDPQPDAEIAHRLGYSRPKVQRVRSSALSKMRNALGA